jgi:hypothetical protein
MYGRWMMNKQMIAAIKKRIEKDYVFDEAGDIVVDWNNDLWWLINTVAQLEAEIERLDDALRQIQHDSQRLLNTVVCSPVYHKVKDTYNDLKRAVEILTGGDDETE